MPLQYLTSFQLLIDKLNKSLGQLVSWFTLVMVCLTFAIVVLRYGFNLGWIALQESVMYLHAAVFLLGAAHTLRLGEHVRVDIFYRAMPASKKARVDFFGTLLLMLPVNFFILVFSWQYVVQSWQLMESSQEAGGLPLVFVLKSFILLFAISMTLQGIAELIRNGLLWLKGEAK